MARRGPAGRPHRPSPEQVASPRGARWRPGGPPARGALPPGPPRGACPGRGRPRRVQDEGGRAGRGPSDRTLPPFRPPPEAGGRRPPRRAAPRGFRSRARGDSVGEGQEGRGRGSRGGVPRGGAQAAAPPGPKGLRYGARWPLRPPRGALAHPRRAEGLPTEGRRPQCRDARAFPRTFFWRARARGGPRSEGAVSRGLPDRRAPRQITRARFRSRSETGRLRSAPPSLRLGGRGAKEGGRGGRGSGCPCRSASPPLPRRPEARTLRGSVAPERPPRGPPGEAPSPAPTRPWGGVAPRVPLGRPRASRLPRRRTFRGGAALSPQVARCAPPRLPLPPPPARSARSTAAPCPLR